jgi:hypothetical protein
MADQHPCWLAARLRCPAVDTFIGFVTLATLIVGYSVPAVVAIRRHHHNTLAIVTTSVLTGWTGVGWVIALVWALTSPCAVPVALGAHICGGPTQYGTPCQSQPGQGTRHPGVGRCHWHDPADWMPPTP